MNESLGESCMPEQDSAPRLCVAGFSILVPTLFGLIALACASLLAFGLYLQYGIGLNPCPMCIVQRYAMIFVLVLGLVGWRLRKGLPLAVFGGLMALFAGFGSFVAARQSWLQWYPPEILSCGRDFYGMIENFPIGRAIPMIFKGSGDCTVVEWTFWGGSIANWSFVWFFGFTLISLLMSVLAWQQARISNLHLKTDKE
jgi:disulfide bond formation protein DsbB